MTRPTAAAPGCAGNSLGTPGVRCLLQDAGSLRERLVRLRRELHSHPETGLRLPRTQQLVLRDLDGLDIGIQVGTRLDSVTAVVQGTRTGPAVLLRADMDALPVGEETRIEYGSRRAGFMHACGHDLHTAALVGAAHLLAERRDTFAGSVVLMFQPGEEGHGGAGHMITEGVLDAAGRRVEAAYGLHVASSVRRGVFSSRPGTLMAASDALTITARGAGTHAAMPHLGRDPITAAAELCRALHGTVARRFDPFDPVVVSVGSLHGGTGRTILPDTVVLEATVRSFSVAARLQARNEIERLCYGIGAAFGVDIEVDYVPEYPPTVNDPVHYYQARRVLGALFGDGRFYEEHRPFPTSDDFARVLAEVPGCYVFLGAGPADGGPAHANHSSRAVFDDTVLPDAAAAYAALALNALGTSGGLNT